MAASAQTLIVKLHLGTEIRRFTSTAALKLNELNERVTNTFDPWPMCSTPSEVQQLRTTLHQRASKVKESTSTVPAAAGGQPPAGLATAVAAPDSPPASQKMQEVSVLERWLAALSKCMRCAPQP